MLELERTEQVNDIDNNMMRYEKVTETQLAQGLTKAKIHFETLNLLLQRQEICNQNFIPITLQLEQELLVIMRPCFQHRQ